MAGGWMARFRVALRTLDALHLAGAATEALPLATFDRSLARAAGVLGVRTVASGPARR
jgi:predicted nucleic acid-binding protein